MQYRSLGNISDHISALGFGCMRIPGEQVDGKWVWDEDYTIKMIRRAIDLGINYFDTAFPYSDGQNERIVGEALSGGYREKVFLTSKLPSWMCEGPEDFSRFFEQQLKNLQTDHLDMYLIHALHEDRWIKMRDWGVMDFLKKLKAEGRIRHYGFSFHGSIDEFKAILNDEKSFEAIQLQYNYYDTDKQAGDEGVRICGELGIPVIVMEGLRGGNLCQVPDDVQAVFDRDPEKRSPIDWAFRFLGDRKEIGLILSGMNTIESLEENVRLFEDIAVGCLNDAQRAMMKDAKVAFEARAKAGCTGCRYCMPCPCGVSIPDIFAVWNDASIFNRPERGKIRYGHMIEKGEDVSRCVGCGRCAELCPQKLSIPELLAAANAEMR